jgi:hypothetical protein
MVISVELGGQSMLQRLSVFSGAISYIDDGEEEPIASNPPASSSAAVSMSTAQIELGNFNVINFGRGALVDEPVDGSNCSIDYDYYLGRKDIIYATTREIKRLIGSSTPSSI